MINYLKMKAPGDYRPTWRGGVIQIHITRACDLSCNNCTQGSNLAGKPVMITLENFEKAVKSLSGYHGVVGIFGGNPVLHPKFKDICEILKSYIPFENRGLWSNNLRGFGKICRETFNPAFSNLNVHCDRDAYNEMKRDWPECNPIGLHDSRHSPPYVAMKDVIDDQSHMEELIENCDINKLWSAMTCQVNGKLYAYFCEIAGAQAMLTNDESTGLLVDDYPNWWKLPIANYVHQVDKHCFNCGIPLKGRGALAITDKLSHASKTWLPIYKLKNNNSVVEVTKRAQLGGSLNRATDYINNAKPPALFYPEY